MTTKTAPSPLRRTDVTKDDKIWKRDSPISENRNSRALLPPLKHITIQSTQELLENFDPLDVLDSASERSASSTDTMIMMTSEEERKNAQRIRNSLHNYESNKQRYSPSLSRSASNQCGDIVKPVLGEISKRKNIPNKIIVPTTNGDVDKQLNGGEKPSHLDEGYGTDSRSNTSASTSSPLSSSFSSLNTIEGLFNQNPPTLNLNHSTGVSSTSSQSKSSSTIISAGNMPRAVITKGQTSSGHQRPMILATKRREPQMEVKDTGPNLEDRLRALTTIQEEEFIGLANAGFIYDKNATSKHSATQPHTRSEFRRLDSPHLSQTQRISHDHAIRFKEQEHSNTGFFHAVPVEITASPPFENQQSYSSDGNRVSLSGSQSYSSVANGPSYPSNSVSPVRRDGWDNYTRYFEKNSDIPPHNISTSSGQGKFRNSRNSEIVSDKDINRQIAGRQMTPPKYPEENVHHQKGLSDLPNHDSIEIPHRENSFDSRLADSEILARDRGEHPHYLSSLPDLRFQSSPWGNDSHHSYLSMSNTNQDGRNGGQMQLNFGQPYQGYGSLRNQQRKQQQPLQHSYPSQGQYIHQANDHETIHSDQGRTLRDDFISLSRSLSKQYIQQREMLQQQQLQHHQCHHPSPSPSPLETQLKSNYDYSTTPVYSTDHPDVLLRNSNLSSSTRSLSSRSNRFSWHPSSNSSYQLQNESEGLNPGISNRASLDLGSIPQLQKQIRATSEMCLQMSKKHKFASSADIYKLFQGQRRPDNRPLSVTGSESPIVSSNRNHLLHRHSFHSTSNSPLIGHQSISKGQNLREEQIVNSPRPGRSSLRLPSPDFTKNPVVSNAGPLRVDHNIGIPQHEFTNIYPEAPNFHNDILQFQRQSSGYSSETELQQIEFNARASRKSRVRDERSMLINPEQEFRPVNPSLDGGSSTGVDDESSLTDNEPVYANQPMIVANSRALERLEMPSAQSSKSETHSPLPPTRIPTHSNSSQMFYSSNPHFIQKSVPQNYQSEHQQEMPISYTHTQNQPKANRSTMRLTDRPIFLSGNQPTSEGEKPHTQKQVINLRKKPVTIKSFIPSCSYSPINGNDVEVDKSLLPQGQQIRNRSFRQAAPELPTAKGSPRFDQSSRSVRNGSTSSLQMSPVDIAQKLDVPFATNIISDENGDRLSTLV